MDAPCDQRIGPQTLQGGQDTVKVKASVNTSEMAQAQGSHAPDCIVRVNKEREALVLYPSPIGVEVHE